jgi:hypothetical protein
MPANQNGPSEQTSGTQIRTLIETQPVVEPTREVTDFVPALTKIAPFLSTIQPVIHDSWGKMTLVDTKVGVKY